MFIAENTRLKVRTVSNPTEKAISEIGSVPEISLCTASETRRLLMYSLKPQLKFVLKILVIACSLMFNAFDTLASDISNL